MRSLYIFPKKRYKILCFIFYYKAVLCKSFIPFENNIIVSCLLRRILLLVKVVITQKEKTKKEKMTSPEAKKKKSNTVSKKTFDTWEYHDEFDVDVDESGNVVKLRCKVCTININNIRREAASRNLRGNVIKGVLNFVDGVDGAHKSNFLRHIKSGGLHSWARGKYGTCASSSSSALTEQVRNAPSREQNQKSIEETTVNNPIVIENYRKLFVTALHIVLTEKPLSDFSNLVDLQKKNGVKFFEGKCHEKACKEFVMYLADVLRDDVKQMLKRVHFFSLSMDGSQPRKTGHEKELLYCKVAIRGKAVELLLKCIHMDDYGGNADDLKRAIDDVMIYDYDLKEEYSDRLVCVCADGASVNMGVYNGAVTQIKETRSWLLDIHCSNHRLELAVQGAFEENVAFANIDTLLMQLYQLTKNSGKVKRLLKATAMRLNVVCLNFVKSSGTRFQNHKYRAIKSLIVNYIPMSELMENYTEPQSRLGTAVMVAKMRGWLKTFREFKFLAALHFYYKTLQQTAHLAFTMQKNDVLISDIKDALGDSVEKLRDLKKEETELPFESHATEDGDVIINVQATNLPATQRFKDENKLSTKERERLEKLLKVHREEYKVRNVHAGKQELVRIKETLLPAIIDHINCRFASFQAPIYESLARIIDHHRWDYENMRAECEMIKIAADHFSIPLKHEMFSLDLAIEEFKGIKRLVKNRYHHLEAATMWLSIFFKHSETFVNIILLAELILCLMWASSTVERGFSAASRLLTPSRRSLGKIMINDLLMLRINLPVLLMLDNNYEEKLIKKAVQKYLPGRYHNTKSSSSKAKPITGGLKECEASEDLFLPIERKDIVNPLLTDEEYLIFSDNDESDAIEDNDELDSDNDEEEDMCDN